ncbi:MAG: YjdF family protein [Oscillibacter sp.]|nr:YjdF family protein [Oscillibacter sp.]
MDTGYAKLTVCFDPPFWICLYERGTAQAWEVCKIVFGAEPADAQVYAYLLENWRKLPFSPPVKGAPITEAKVNPKRRQREIKKALSAPAIGTKAQQAWKLQQTEGKAARRQRTKEERQAEAERKYALRQEKRKEKHRGH